MLVTLRPLADIQPYAANPRKNDHAVAAVAASIREFGFRQPIVVDGDGVIVVGHTRYKAALQLGLTRVPIHVATDLSPAQLKAFRIADNKTGELAEWDHDRLVAELAELEQQAYDLQPLGFSAEELQVLRGVSAQPGLTDPDAVPEPPAAATTQPGDLWLLGQHRLLCGDAGNTDDVDRLLQGAPIHLIHTDPPYGVKVEPRSNNAIAAGLSSFAGTTHHQQLDVRRDPKKAQRTTRKLRAKDRPLVNDFLPAAEFNQLLRAWFGQCSRVLLPGHSFFVWGGYGNLGNYPPALHEAGLYFSQAIIWDKQHPVLTRKDFMGAHETCFYGWKEGAAHRFFGPNNITDLWAVKKVNPQQMTHLTEKPVELAARALAYSSLPGEHVLDLFGGSGSTLIAAEQAGRRAFLMEVDPLYCDVIVRRFEQFAGQPATWQAAPRRGATTDTAASASASASSTSTSTSTSTSPSAAASSTSPSAAASAAAAAE